MNIIEQFNVGNFEYLIATDESADDGKTGEYVDDEASVDKIDIAAMSASKLVTNKKAIRGNKKDSEYGVSRGLDFRGVSFVVNVDFPSNPESYTHRVGRTARGGAKGVALSFVELDSLEQFRILEEVQTSQPRLPVAASASDVLYAAGQSENNLTAHHPSATSASQPQPTPLDFDLVEIEGFRYRVEDVGRAVTKVAVEETRAAELKAEILNSQRLQSHFAENPADLQILRHDRQATHVSKIQDHLK